MDITGFIKRMLPFVAAFAIGVFIASFFVDLSKPRFGGPRWRGKRYVEMQRLRVENEDLRNENLRLKNQLENMHMHPVTLKHPELDELPAVGIDGLTIQSPPAARQHK
jgi:hypothetical protein